MLSLIQTGHANVEAVADMQFRTQLSLTWRTGCAAEVGAGVESGMEEVPDGGDGEGSAGGEGDCGGVEGVAAGGDGGSAMTDPADEASGEDAVELGAGAGAAPPLSLPGLSG